MLIEIRKAYVKAILPLAQVLNYRLKVQIEFVILHAAHESNWGQSQLAKMGHNHFGATPGEAWERAMRNEIKTEAVMPWTKLDGGRATIGLPTREYIKNVPPEKVRFFCFPGDIKEKKPDGKGGTIASVERSFRRYESDLECFKDYGDRISLPRYEHVLYCAKSGSLKEFCDALGAAGYGTDLFYAENLFNLYPALQKATEGEKIG